MLILEQRKRVLEEAVEEVLEEAKDEAAEEAAEQIGEETADEQEVDTAVLDDNETEDQKRASAKAEAGNHDNRL
jgi:hypothetical protein